MVRDTRGHNDLDRLYMQILSACSNLDHLKLVIGAIILVRMPLSLGDLAISSR